MIVNCTSHMRRPNNRCLLLHMYCNDKIERDCMSCLRTGYNMATLNWLMLTDLIKRVKMT